VRELLLAVESPVGAWGVAGNEAGLTRIYMPHEPFTPTVGDVSCVTAAATQLTDYFAGVRRTFEVELAPVPATEFQRDVWRALRAIPYGEVLTYGEVAAAVRRPNASRAVGNANHANPWPVIIPCHRVVASTGLGGYGGGVDVKRYLLGLEGVSVAS